VLKSTLLSRTETTMSTLLIIYSALEIGLALELQERL
jgi:hypothetical protein